MSSAVLIDGKACAARVRAALKDRVAARQSRGSPITLAVVLAGDDPASHVYVRHKERACAEVGIRSIRVDLPAAASTSDVLAVIARLADDTSVHGILVQLPLPAGVDTERVLRAVPAEKDVDGFHPDNAGLLFAGTPRFVPCTPAGIMWMLDDYKVPLAGADAVVIGRSRIVGLPVATLLTQRSATVTVCHSKSRDLPGHVRRADIVVAAVGRPELVRGDWLKPGAVVIDVGINRLADGRLVGDVAFDEAMTVVKAITPVPGGVGPMTIAMLLENTLAAAGG